MESPFQRRRVSLLRPPLSSTQNEQAHNLSITLLPEEQEMLRNTSAGALGLLSRLQNRTAHNANEISRLSGTDGGTFAVAVDDVNDDADYGRGKADVLFAHFYEIHHTHTNANDTLDVVQQLVQACQQIVDQLQIEIERGVGGNQGAKQREASVSWLKQEINTWRLLYGLYHDRLLLQADAHAEDELMMQDGPMLGASEKEVIQQLFSINAQLREYQLVIDWLEKCHEQSEQSNALQSHDRMMAWENTLFQLENLQGAAFGRGHEICRQLDPDAPVRERQPLHALDMEDNGRLSRAIFAAIRSGHIDEALKLCKHYGQTWRAAILEGWRLHEDPNCARHVGGQANEKLPIEGNPRRDIWKRCAWLLANSTKYDEYTRATAGVFCGHLDALKSLLHNSWQDLLWAYLKVQIDIRVESEIRGCCLKRYQPMPDEYWNGKMTLEQIFDELNVAKDLAVRDYAQSQLGVIQQHLILDTAGELLKHMCRWLDAVPKESQLPPHQLRFMAHIVLFMRRIGRLEPQPQQQQADRIIAAYVDALIQRGDPQPIAYYSAGLPKKLQVQLYAKFLTHIHEKRPRELALEAAIQAGLDVEQITLHTVESICVDGTPVSAMGEPHTGEISAGDKRKIQSLEYLIHLVEQRGELLWQANAMMRQYLASNKIECVRRVFSMVPDDVTAQLIKIYGAPDNFPPREECSLREYLCFRIYLAGIDSFNDWTQLQQTRPQPPEPGAQKSTISHHTQDNFTERMNAQHKEKAYLSDLSRWKQKLKEQSKITTEALFNVLLFPEKGWLNDPFIAKEPENASLLHWEHRLVQMEKLRSICLPEIVLLLHEVMMKSNDFAGCVRLADEIADEGRQLYKVYTKHKLADVLSKIADSSLQLLNIKLDPWGYPITA
ncbi:nuclear pore complex protein Nup107 [Drosophila grimshawi]|uniref:Nuclear pore complex protein n=1 Tax=Drosophila grimshawi TaxID=7222 RepID=B4JE54_DROGR|nr:nuclear pore complex protein Nup107 [Drosophila grimshawi]EDW03574.1 GH11309 [Drosophila grimshawi]